MVQTNKEPLLQAFVRKYPTQIVAEHEVLILANENPTVLFYLEEGSVRMSVSSTDRRRMMVHLFQPGTLFPLLMLLPEPHNRYDFVAMEAVVVRAIPLVELEVFLAKHPGALSELFTHAVAGLFKMAERLEQQTFNTAREQVASVLLYLAKHYAESGDDEEKQAGQLRLKFTHQDIADWTGLSRENVSLHMKALERSRLIGRDKRYTIIVNLPRLQKLAAHGHTGQ